MKPSDKYKELLSMESFDLSKMNDSLLKISRIVFSNQDALHERLERLEQQLLSTKYANAQFDKPEPKQELKLFDELNKKYNKEPKRESLAESMASAYEDKIGLIAPRGAYEVFSQAAKEHVCRLVDELNAENSISKEGQIDVYELKKKVMEA